MTAALSQTPEILLVGHISLDVTGEGSRVGGTVAYAGATLAVLGHKVGAVTSTGPNLEWEPPRNLTLENIPAETSTSFENQYMEGGRRQMLHSRAVDLDIDMVPTAWRSAPVVLLAPIADEIDPAIVKELPDSWIALTPQGWLRRWNAAGEVRRKEIESISRLPRARMAFLSQEDLNGEDIWIERLADRYRWFILTEAEKGARVYHQDTVTHFPAPQVDTLDPTGAGDIFAACFISRYLETKDSGESARFANQLAALSTTRVGMDSIPTAEEIENAREQASL